jgi:hypothetical protein
MRKLLVAAAFATLMSASAARADITPRDKVPVGGMDNQISIWGIYSYHYSFGGYGLGARYQKTVLPEGVLKNAGIRDDIGIEGGIDYVHYSWDYSFGSNYTWTYNEFSVVVGAVWNFWLTPQLAVYPKLDLGVGFGSWSTPSGFGGSVSHPTSGGLLFQGAVGAVYKLDRLALRAEAGTGYLRAGVAFNF